MTNRLRALLVLSLLVSLACGGPRGTSSAPTPPPAKVEPSPVPATPVSAAPYPPPVKGRHE
jgi:hypothetical protein